MKAGLLCLLLCLSWGQAQDKDPYLMVLKDGRTVSYQGEFSLEGDKITFTTLTGETTSINADLVDMAETLKARKVVDEKQTRVNRNTRPLHEPEEKDTRSLAEQVEEYQRETGYDPAKDRKQLKYTGPDEAEDADSQSLTPKALRGFSKKPGEFSPAGLEKLQKKLQEDSWSKGLTAFVVFGVLIGLASFVAWLYVLFTSFRYSVGWGLAVTISAACTVVSGLALPAASWAPIAQLAIYLLHYLLLGIYIILWCHGKRVLLLTLIYLPWVVSVVAALWLVQYLT